MAQPIPPEQLPVRRSKLIRKQLDIFDYHPDHHPSFSAYHIEDRKGRSPILALEVLRLGALVITDQGISIFTTDEIQFEDHAEFS